MAGQGCSRGWARRCPESRGKRCRCACGGRNHGTARPKEPETGVPGRLTDSGVFVPEWVCTSCGTPMAQCRCETPRFEEKNYRFFLPSAENVGPIRLERGNVNVPHRYVVHSPTGFSWGYGGSGPADLALNILALFIPPQEAWRLHQAFKWDVIAGVPHEGTVIEPAAVRAWIERQWAAEEAEVAAGGAR